MCVDKSLGPICGPWRVEGEHHLHQGSHAFVLGGEFIIATVHADCPGLKARAPSNLRLISAAPELAAACEAMLALLMDGVLLNGPSSSIVNEQLTKLAAMRALLNAGIDFGPRRDPFAALKALSEARAEMAEPRYGESA